jgi:hypothetical protein
MKVVGFWGWWWVGRRVGFVESRLHVGHHRSDFGELTMQGVKGGR